MWRSHVSLSRTVAGVQRVVVQPPQNRSDVSCNFSTPHSHCPVNHESVTTGSSIPPLQKKKRKTQLQNSTTIHNNLSIITTTNEIRYRSRLLIMTSSQLPLDMDEEVPLLTSQGRSISFGGESATRRAMTMIERARAKHGSSARAEPGRSRQAGLNDVLKELESQERQSWTSLLLAIFGIAGHFFGGAVFLSRLEGWSLTDSIYFCIVTTTTVGYGDITPKENISKVFVVGYVVMSIGLMSTLLATMVGSILDQQEEMILAAMFGESSTEDDDAVEEANEQGLNFSQRIVKYTSGLNWCDYYGLGMSALWLLWILIIGVVVFLIFEKFSFIDALYTTVISASTVGFGDLEPKQRVTKIIMSFWLIFSTIGLVKVIANFTDASVKAKQRAVSRRMLTAQLDVSTWSAMDKDKDGRVNKLEFLTELLVRSGKVERREIDAILCRFEELDHDGNGRINLDEISQQTP